MPDQPPRTSPDPAAEWWTLAEVAAYLGVKPVTVYRYRKRPLEEGGLPPEDAMISRTPVYRPATVITWNEDRAGQGARTDLRAGGQS